MTDKCCMCKQPVECPAHEATVQKRYNGWAPGRYVARRQVWCGPCWDELLKVNRASQERNARQNARILAEHGLVLGE